MTLGAIFKMILAMATLSMRLVEVILIVALSMIFGVAHGDDSEGEGKG